MRSTDRVGKNMDERSQEDDDAFAEQLKGIPWHMADSLRPEMPKDLPKDHIVGIVCVCLQWHPISFFYATYWVYSASLHVLVPRPGLCFWSDVLYRVPLPVPSEYQAKGCCVSRVWAGGQNLKAAYYGGIFHVSLCLLTHGEIVLILKKKVKGFWYVGNNEHRKSL